MKGLLLCVVCGLTLLCSGVFSKSLKENHEIRTEIKKLLQTLKSEEAAKRHEHLSEISDNLKKTLTAEEAAKRHEKLSEISDNFKKTLTAEEAAKRHEQLSEISDNLKKTLAAEEAAKGHEQLSEISDNLKKALTDIWALRESVHAGAQRTSKQEWHKEAKGFFGDFFNDFLNDFQEFTDGVVHDIVSAFTEEETVNGGGDGGGQGLNGAGQGGNGGGQGGNGGGNGGSIGGNDNGGTSGGSDNGGTSGTWQNDRSCGLRQSYQRNLLTELKSLLRSMGDARSKRSVPADHAKIVNGRLTDIAQFPWVVFMQIPSLDGSGYFMCGGSLITPTWVLTAAHCLEKVGDLRMFTVRVGEHSLASDVEHHEDIPVKRYILHPQYNTATVRNDIALIELSHAANTAENHINTICLSDEGFDVGDDCIVAGWGDITTNQEQRTSDVLRRADIRLEPDNRCPYEGGLSDGQFCGGGSSNGNTISLPDSCQGDSGGPLFCRRNSHYIQAGVVSFGNICGDPAALGVYTDVSKYMDWIMSQVN